LRDFHPDLLALEHRPVEELDRALGLGGIQLDEGEALETRIEAIASSGPRPLAQRPAQVVFADPAALTAVDEELDQLAVAPAAVLVGLCAWRARGGAAGRVLEAFLGSLQSPMTVFASRSIRGISLSCVGVTRVIALRCGRPGRCGRCGARRTRWCRGRRS